MVDAAEKFPGLPDDLYEYENDFDYKLWGTGSTIKLCNVPWDSEYRLGVKFPGGTRDRDAYFDNISGTSLTLETATILKFGQPLELPIPFSESNKYNYVVVDSPETYNSGLKRYCYFITYNEQVAPNSTTCYIMCDYFTSYIEEFDFINGYLISGHYPVQKTKNVDDFFIFSGGIYPELNATESIEYGEDYITSDLEFKSFQKSSDVDSYCIIIQSTVNLTGDIGTVEKPDLSTAHGKIVNQVPSGCEIYGIRPTDFAAFMEAISPYPYIAQNIQSIMYVPAILTNINSSFVNIIKGTIQARLYENNPGFLDFERVSWNKNRYNYPEKYSYLTKLFCYPYSVLEITDNEGQSIIFKPEHVVAQSQTDIYFDYRGVLTPPFTRLTVELQGYNSFGGGNDKTYDVTLLDGQNRSITWYSDDRFEKQLVLNTFPTFSLVINSYLNSLASTANSREHAYDTATWTLQKSQMSAQASYDLSQRQIQASNTNTDLQLGAASNSLYASQSAAQDSLALNSVAGVVGGAAGGLTGGIAGAAVGAGSGVANALVAGQQQNIQFALQNQQNSIAANLALSQQSNNNALANYSADTNLQLASIASQGDYENTIAGLNAQVSDARITPPTTAGNAGGNGYLVANGLTGYTVKFKRISDSSLSRVVNQWLRFGYQYRDFIFDIPSSLMCMQKFTYWKFQELNVSSSTNVPSDVSSTIRGIFERGITIFNDPDEVAKMDFDGNLPL